MTNIEVRIRSMTIQQLKALRLLADSTGGIASQQEISDTTHTASFTLGAILASLTKCKTDKGSLILPAGRDEEGMRWQLNEDVIDRDQLKEILNKMKIW